MRAKSSACEITSPPSSRRSHSHVCHWVKCINSFTARIDNSTFPSSRQLLSATFYFWLSEGFIFFLSMAQLQQWGQSRALFAVGDSLLCQGEAGFEPTPAGNNVWCSLLAFQAVLQKEILLLWLKGCFSCLRGKNWRVNGKDRKGGVHLVIEPRLCHSALYDCYQ